MKSVFDDDWCAAVKSLPLLGEWVEINSIMAVLGLEVSLPLLGEWVEIHRHRRIYKLSSSLPLLGEWVEMMAN